MCGIAGILGRSDRKRLAHMLDAQRHRGPDGRRIWTAGDGSFTLGHDRLAIVDVAGGTQPLANEDGTLWLAMNGEIYNHLELRRELEGRHTFRTRSDSEVVLHLFEEEGPDCVRRLDGMFALAIWGAEAGLLLARDPLGIKPLYFGYDQAGTLGFASEIRPLLDTVCQVRSLPNGSYWQVGRPMVRYYEVPRPVSALSDEHEAVDRLQQTLVRAVRKRLMADVPLGVFLSGGLDSSLIAAIVRRQTWARFTTSGF